MAVIIIDFIYTHVKINDWLIDWLILLPSNYEILNIIYTIWLGV